METRCNKKTKGTITGYTPYRTSSVHLPKVEYTVGQQTYTVVGPQFESVISRVKMTPFANPVAQIQTNLTDRQHLPKVLRLTVSKNSILSLLESPLKELYPIGSQADVYYNPKDPKESFVQRFCLSSPKWLMIPMCLAELVCLIAAVWILLNM